MYLMLSDIKEIFCVDNIQFVRHKSCIVKEFSSPKTQFQSKQRTYTTYRTISKRTLKFQWKTYFQRVPFRDRPTTREDKRIVIFRIQFVRRVKDWYGVLKAIYVISCESGSYSVLSGVSAAVPIFDVH